MTYKVHGVIQGVGYRNYVRRIAKLHGIVGNVRNVMDGSVEILAIGSQTNIAAFEKDIQVNDQYGPQVMHIERIASELNEGDESTYTDFRIEKDRKL